MLNLDTENKLKLETSDLIGRSVAVLGITGSGKTNTAAVIIEELLTAGLPLTIVDIEGEYWGLKERFEILVAGRSANIDVTVTVEQAPALAELSLSKGISVILDLSEFSGPEQQEFVLAYFTKLWEVSAVLKRPYQIVLEEAHEFIPQSVRTPVKEILTRIALRGRKRGLGIIMMSQRSPKVEKDVLTQAQLFFLHRVVHPADVSVYQDIIPLPTKEVEQMVASLEKGSAIVLFEHKPQVVKIRLRHTYHVGATPSLDLEKREHVKKIDAKLLAEFGAVLTPTAPTPDRPKTIVKVAGPGPILLKENAALKTKVADLETEINKLKAKLETAKPPALPKIEIHQHNHTETKVAVQTNVSIQLGKTEVVRLDKLVKDIKAIPKISILSLKYLIQAYPTRRSFAQLAAESKLVESSIRRGLGAGLEKLGVISREWDAVVIDTDYFRDRFPGREPEQILKLLTEKL